MDTPAGCRIGRDDLPSMLSTLCSYESLFGPCHFHTLHLMVETGLALCHYGEVAYAGPLLERAARDLGRCFGRENETRLRALAALRGLLVEQGQYEKASAIQAELQANSGLQGGRIRWQKPH
jgi:hypothetical protein